MACNTCSHRYECADADAYYISDDSVSTVMIGCPIRNRGWIAEKYLACIYNLNYPKTKIHLCFIVNDSTDNTLNILREFKKSKEEEYAGIDIVIKNFNQIPDARITTTRQKIYSSLAELRNILLEKVHGNDYLFSVDSDILFEPDTLNKLLMHRKDIVSAQIWNDSSNTFPNVMIRKDSSFRHYLEFPRDSIFKCDVTGAIYLISREVINAGVKYKYHHQGEDIAFCLSAQEKGFELWCDPTIKCRHIMHKGDVL